MIKLFGINGFVYSLRADHLTLSTCLQKWGTWKSLVVPFRFIFCMDLALAFSSFVCLLPCASSPWLSSECCHNFVTLYRQMCTLQTFLISPLISSPRRNPQQFWGPRFWLIAPMQIAHYFLKRSPRDDPRSCCQALLLVDHHHLQSLTRIRPVVVKIPEAVPGWRVCWCAVALADRWDALSSSLCSASKSLAESCQNSEYCDLPTKDVLEDFPQIYHRLTGRHELSSQREHHELDSWIGCVLP
jgi:hypothetical protein